MEEKWMIEIDPELFMTCRLCIKEKGKFQILPVLQDKIKFCLDIPVNLFDGLSQLICGKCKDIIHEYSNVKATFQSKQAALLAKTKQQSLQVVQEAVTSSQPDDKPSQSDIRISKKKKSHKKHRMVRVLSSSSTSEDGCIVQDESPALSDKESVEIVEKNDSDIEILVNCSTNPPETVARNSWKDLFHRNFVCRYCSMTLSYKKSIRDHIHTHSALLRKKRDIKGNCAHCVVQLERFDELKNLTGGDDVVVLSPNRLLSDEGNADYYVMYTGDNAAAVISQCDDEKESRESSDAETVILHTKRRFTCTDIASSDDDQARPKLRKRIRLMSLDFSEDNNSKESDGNSDECQNDANYNRVESLSDVCTIVEPSNDEDKGTVEAEIALKPSTSERKSKKDKGSRMSDYKVIHNIATLSLQKFSKKLLSKDPHKKSSRKSIEGVECLMRKVLNFGRKTIFKEGPSSIGLMKYLEHMNLKIQFNQISNSRGKECVRLLAKLMVKPEVNNMSGFQAVVETEEVVQETEAEKRLLSSPVTNKNYKSPKTNSKPNKESRSLLNKTILTPKAAELTPAPDASTVGRFLLPALPKTAYANTDIAPAPTDKSLESQTAPNYLLNLLNASPVANPKKAPKKKGIVKDDQDSHAKLTRQFSNTVDPKRLTPIICIDLDEEPSADSGSADASMPVLTATSIAEVPMPVIASTTSYNNMANHMAERTTGSSNRNSNEENSSKNHVPFITTAEHCMPIITATTSLANVNITNSTMTSSEENDKNTKDRSNNYPRIKCKPVSELMKNRLTTEPQATSSPQTNVSATPYTMPPTVPVPTPERVSEVPSNPGSMVPSNPGSMVPSNHGSMVTSNPGSMVPSKPGSAVPSNPGSMVPSNPGSMVPSNPGSGVLVTRPVMRPIVVQQKELNNLVPPMAMQQPPQSARVIPPGHVVLHTVALPNTVTNSPFNYFKQLLSIHSLNLLDCRNSGGAEYVNLAKFRLGVHQSPTSIVLSLHLQAKGLNFRILIFNEDGLNVDLREMTALWQLEVLKAFHSESVVTKIINSAKKTRVVSENNAVLFVSLLKSIELRKS